MSAKFYILHDIPGRLRLHVPALRIEQQYEEISSLFLSLTGVRDVKIQPIIQTLLIQYDQNEITRNHLLKCVSAFFQQDQAFPLNSVIGQLEPKIRGNIIRSLIAGGLLLVAYLQGTSFKQPTALAYGAVIATGYAVLSHGTQNKLRHPDIITGILSLVSLGPSNMLHGAMITWAVNVLELLHEMKTYKTLYFHTNLYEHIYKPKI